MAKQKRKYQSPLHIDQPFEEALERFAAVAPAEVDEEVRKDRVRLVQRGEDSAPVLIYATPKGTEVELPFKGETLWATQKQMAEMFGVQVPAVNKHLVNIFKEDEVDAVSAISRMEITAADGKRYETMAYNLDAVISVGYRVTSKQGTAFRVWATQRLIQILTKGFYVDTERLKNGGDADALDEFREIAREIRTSIRNSYREVLRLCTLCSDYDGSGQAARDFFMEMENKLLWASAGKTAPQLVLERADADKDDMGLTYYAGKRGPTKQDVVIGNNYLANGEATTKNRITEMWLTYVEDQLDQGRLPTMEAVREKLIGFINFNQWPLLRDFGRHKRDDANNHALEQLDLYRVRLKAEAEAGKPKKLEKKG